MAEFLFITDLDNTLVGDDAAMQQLLDQLTHHRDQYGTKIVYSTGRSLTSYQQLKAEKQLVEPDALVTGVGTAIYHQEAGEPNADWATLLSQNWDRERVRAIADSFEDLMPQPDSEQGPFKVSYYLHPSVAPNILPQLEAKLQREALAVNLIYSGSKDFDLLPANAHKGYAMTFLRNAYGFAPERTVACGDSGNDRAFFAVGTERGIIVGNAMPELLDWHSHNPADHRYLAQAHYAAGVLEGLAFFGFLAS